MCEQFGQNWLPGDPLSLLQIKKNWKIFFLFFETVSFSQIRLLREVEGLGRRVEMQS